MKQFSTVLCASLVGLSLAAAVPVRAQNFSDDDKKFLDKSTQGSVAEVELGKLAEKKASSPQVKMFARRMVHDHTMLGVKMKPLVTAAGLHPGDTLNSEHQSLYDKLNGLSGADFDKEYVKAMDADHHDDLKEFDDEIASTKNEKLKLTVENGRKVIAEHTSMIDSISKSMGLSTKS